MILEDLVEIRSVSGDEEELLDYLIAWYKEKDVNLQKVGTNLIVEYDGSGPPRIFNAHMDTIKPEGWDTNPFSLKEETDKYRGLGVSDMKVTIHILMHLHEYFQSVDNKVILTFVEKEETTGEGSEKITEILDEEYEVDEALCIIGEPTDAEWFEIGNRGNIFFEKEIHGKSVHSGRPSEGENAVKKAMKEIDDDKQILKQKHEKNERLGQSTLAIPTQINGGSSINTVPGKTTYTSDFRTVPENHEKVVKTLRSVGYDIVSETKPYLLKDENILAALKEHGELRISPGSNDATFFGQINIPTVVFGAGTKECIHQPEEYVLKENIEKTKEMYKTLLTIK